MNCSVCGKHFESIGALVERLGIVGSSNRRHTEYLKGLGFSVSEIFMGMDIRKLAEKLQKSSP